VSLLTAEVSEEVEMPGACKVDFLDCTPPHNLVGWRTGTRYQNVLARYLATSTSIVEMSSSNAFGSLSNSKGSTILSVASTMTPIPMPTTFSPGRRRGRMPIWMQI